MSYLKERERDKFYIKSMVRLLGAAFLISQFFAFLKPNFDRMWVSGCIGTVFSLYGIVLIAITKEENKGG